MFLAVARTGGFTRAANHLGLSQSAVSHAVARLERSVAANVFQRTSTGVVLTDVGRRLYDEVQAGFDRVDRAVEAARAAELHAVTLSVSTSLASFWLLPRLANFKHEHPSIEIHCHTNDTDRGVGRDGADIWIPLGGGPWPGLQAHHFCDEEIILVAAPEMAARWDDVDMAGLIDAPLLHLDERYQPRYDWEQWFDHFGVAHPRRLGGARSNDYSLIVDAAIDGQGIALGWVHLMTDLIAGGRLRQVGTGRVRTSRPFTLLVRQPTSHGSAIESLTRWLIERAPQISADQN